MTWVLAGCVVGLVLLNVIHSRKINILAKALFNTNKALNETRELVAKHQKQLKRQ